MIPSSLAELRNLRVLDVSHNNFEGSVWIEFGLLTNACDINLQNNNKRRKSSHPPWWGTIRGTADTSEMTAALGFWPNHPFRAGEIIDQAFAGRRFREKRRFKTQSSIKRRIQIRLPASRSPPSEAMGADSQGGQRRCRGWLAGEISILWIRRPPETDCYCGDLDLDRLLPCMAEQRWFNLRQAEVIIFVLRQDFREELHLKLYTLRQEKESVIDYIRKFEKLVIHCNVPKPMEHTIAWFFRGLNRDIARIIELQLYYSLEDVYKLYVKVEKQKFTFKT